MNGNFDENVRIKKKIEFSIVGEQGKKCEIFEE